jgi:hypothetical protein
MSHSYHHGLRAPIREIHIAAVTRHLERHGGYRCLMCLGSKWIYVGYD